MDYLAMIIKKVVIKEKIKTKSGYQTIDEEFDYEFEKEKKDDKKSKMDNYDKKNRSMATTFYRKNDKDKDDNNMNKSMDEKIKKEKKEKEIQNKVEEFKSKEYKEFNKLISEEKEKEDKRAKAYEDEKDEQKKLEIEKKNKEERELASQNINKNKNDIEQRIKEYENPLIKFNILKSKIDDIEKEIKIYSESQNLIQHDETLDEYFERIKKLKETLNFISNSKNYYELKKILDKNKDKNVDKFQILQNKMIENLNMHLINRANIINKLKSQNPEEYNDLDYELYLTPETKKIKRISKILEIKEKINKVKEKIGNIELDNNKENLFSIIKDLKEKIRIYDSDFKKKIEEQKNIISKRVREMDMNDDFYNILDKEYLDDLYTGFKNAEEIEDIITETVSKMENMKERHEISAFVGIKLQELIEQQVKLGNEINDNMEILINLKKNIKNNVSVMKKNLEILKSKLGIK